jgi:Uma2 family endonuclease
LEVTSEVEVQAMVVAETDEAAAASELAELERLWQRFEPMREARIELIDGEIVVSPTPSVRHSTAVDELAEQFFEVKRRHGWRFHTWLTCHIAPTRERLIPDLMVAPKDARQFGDDELLAPGVLLAAEVVSWGSRRRDREVKPRAYARGGVPLYLMIDRFADPAAVTLFSEPDEQRYRRRQMATAGKPLRLPDPFGIELDTARLLS